MTHRSVIWYCFLTIALTFAIPKPIIANDILKATNSSIAQKGNNNSASIGISEKEYQARLEKYTAALKGEIQDLKRDLQEMYHSKGVESGKVELLKEQLAAKESALSDAERKTADIKNAYADLKIKVHYLNQELNKMRQNNTGRIPPEIFDKAIAAVNKGDLSTANQIIAPLLEKKLVENVIRDQARVYYISGLISEEELNYRTAKSHYNRAAELEPNETHYKNKFNEVSKKITDAFNIHACDMYSNFRDVSCSITKQEGVKLIDKDTGFELSEP